MAMRMRPVRSLLRDAAVAAVAECIVSSSCDVVGPALIYTSNERCRNRHEEESGLLPLSFRGNAELAETIDGFARSEVIQLEQLANLDLAFLVIAERGGEALRPLDALLSRLHLDERVAGDDLLRLGEGTIDPGASSAGESDACPFRRWLESRCVEQDTGFREFLVVVGHDRHECRIGRHPGFRLRVAFDNDHESHRASPV